MTPTQPPSRWIQKRLARLTVDQYEAMVDSGVFTKRDRFTLINGYLVAKVPKSPRHTFVAKNLGRKLNGLIPSGWDFRIEDAYAWRTPSQSLTYRWRGEPLTTTSIATRDQPIWRWSSRSPRRMSPWIARWPRSTGRPASLSTGYFN